MVYKNFFLRSIFSIFLASLYFSITIINFNFVFYLILIIYVLIIIEVLYFFKNYRLVPLVYIILSFIFFLIIDFDNKFKFSFHLYIFTVVFFDTFSYVIGKSIGKNKLIHISPNKTVEGLIGGFVASLTFSMVFATFLNFTISVELVFFIITIIFCALLGDLIESYFKRKNNLKNSSNLIPGHGGVFDRFDSFLFSIIFYSISINLLI